MLKLKIAIYTICKNESQHVERWAASNQDADLRIVCDTGSTDNTVELLKSKGVTVYDITVNPWRFDVARNTSLNLVPEDIDVCIWQDLDEALLEGWRKQIEDNWTEDTTIANHRYRNNDNPWQWHSKIHARHNCWWTGAVHETLKWSVPEKAIWLDEFYLDEKQDVTKNRSYLNLLLKKISEDDQNWRTYAFLAGEYESTGNMKECVKTRLISYEKCDDGPVVKSYIAKIIAKNYVAMEDYTSAEKWFQISVTDSNERESWFNYADYWHNREDWEQCYIAAKKCLSVEIKRDGFTQDPKAWGALPYDYAALSAYHIGFTKQAVEYGEEALKLMPDDTRLIHNLKFYKEKLNDQSS